MIKVELTDNEARVQADRAMNTLKFTYYSAETMHSC